MKRHFNLFILFHLLFALLIQKQANAQVGIGTATPTSSSILDLTSTTKGMLTPRMTSAEKTAITSPATGLLIYQTDGSSGFWYYDGTTWLEQKGWTSLGNSGTVAGTNFFGTTDSVDLVTRTNNTERMRITGSGKVGIGTTTPAELLEVAGNIRSKHFIGSTPVPTLTAGPGAGGTPSGVSITGSDVAGKITFTTGGTAPTANAIIYTLNFNTAYGTAPYVQITPANTATARLTSTAGKFPFVNSTSTTTFTINSGATALSNATQYSFYYHVIQ